MLFAWFFKDLLIDTETLLGKQSKCRVFFVILISILKCLKWFRMILKSLDTHLP